MATQKVRPDPDALERERQEKRRHGSKQRTAVYAGVVAALLAVAAIVAITLPGDRSLDVGTDTRPETPTGRYHLNLTIGATTPLPDSLPEASLYAVSPDGTMVAGAPCCTPPNPVWVANIDGTGVREITPEGIDGFAPRWSPDGSMLVYQERDAIAHEIGNLVVADVATGERTTITDLPSKSYGTWSLHPSFSADGRSVLFHMPRGSDIEPVGWDLVSIPVTGGDTTVLRRDAIFGASSPLDGALVYVDPTTWTLFLADAEGRNARILLAAGEEIDRPRWSPTGSEVAYADASGVHIVDVATGEVSLVTDGDPVDWSW